MRRSLAAFAAACLLAAGLLRADPAATAERPLEALETYLAAAAKASETNTREALLGQLDEKARVGDGAAAAVLGLLYELGENGYPRDMKKAVAYYERALERNRDFVAARLAYLYLYGIEVPRDKEKARMLFRRAVYRVADEPKQVRSILFEGVMLISRPFPPEFDDAVAWAQEVRKKSAEELLAESEALRTGPNKLRDNRLADFLMAEAADKGHPVAQYRLAQIILAEAEEPEHLQAGLSYLHEAAARGLAEAQTDLGQRYMAGRDLAQDDTKAFYWLSRAAQSGARDAAPVLADLAATLDPASKAKAVGWLNARQHPPL